MRRFVSSGADVVVGVPVVSSELLSPQDESPARSEMIRIRDNILFRMIFSFLKFQINCCNPARFVV